MGKILLSVRKDINENIVSILYFVIQLCLCSIFLIVCGVQLMLALTYGNHIKQMRDYNIVNFNMYYGQRGISNYDDLDNMLINELDIKDSSYAYVDSITLSKYPNYKVMIGLGQFTEIYGITYHLDDKIKNTDDILVLIGSEVEELDIGDIIEIGVKKTTLQVNGLLDKNASYLRGINPISLKNSILIITQYSTMESWYPNYYTSDTVTSMGLIEPNKKDLEEIMSVIMDSDSLNISPKYFNTTSAKEFNNLINNTYFFLVLFLCVLLFTSIGIISSLLLMIEKNMKAYAIHRLYGATLIILYLRVILYVVFILVLPFLLCMFLLNIYGGVYDISPFWLVITFSSIIGLLSMLPIYYLKKKDMTYFLRGDY